MREWAVGIDIGGTNTQAAVVRREDGTVIARLSQPTLADQGPQSGLARIGDLVAAVLAQVDRAPADLAGIGIGCTGPLDVERGLIMEPWTMPGWREVPIGPVLAERFGLPVWLDNDCNVAALGEHWIGAGQGHKDMLYITVSTGIGAGIIIDNRLRRGFGFNMGEVGLMSIDLDGPVFEDIPGCWEHLAAGPAIARTARELADESMRAAVGGDLSRLTAERVARLAIEGNEVARAIVDQEALYLGVGLANLIVILSPEIVVLGGGVMESWSQLQPGVEAVVRKHTHLIPSAQQIPLVRAQLGLAAGFTGAARLVFLAEQAHDV